MPQNLEAIVQRMIDAGESEENIATVIKASKVQPQTDSGALGLAAVKPAAGLAMEMATNPGFPKATATLGRIGGAVLPMAVGSKYGASGMASGALGAAAGSWSGGKTGYFTGKLLQNAASPVARGLETVAHGANTLAGASGVGDLAQMAEPNRKDIGFLGIGPSVDVPGAQPPVLNDLIARIRARFTR